MDERVEKLRVVPRVAGYNYWRVGLDDYLLWALHDSVTFFTLVSTGLCKALGLAVDRRLAGTYSVADGSTRKFRFGWSVRCYSFTIASA